MKYLMSLTCLIASMTFAKESQSHHHKGHHGHKSHKAHVHGHGTLELAFDGLNGSVHFLAPAESIVGFEHEAKSEAQKKVVSEASQKFETQISQMIQFDPALGCQFTKEKVEMKSEKKGKHADFIADFKVVCQKAISGSSVKVDFTSWAQLEKIEITVLAGDLQKSAQAQKQAVQIDLK